jgi:hypothetical protein
MDDYEKVINEKMRFIKKGIKKKRNTWTPNDILINESYSEIILRDNRQRINGICFIDTDDLDLIKQYKWNNCQGYARTSINGKTIRLHRLILNCPDKFIDHINHNTLDNRRQNLRIVTPKENNKNKKYVKDKPPRIFDMR